MIEQSLVRRNKPKNKLRRLLLAALSVGTLAGLGACSDSSAYAHGPNGHGPNGHKHSHGIAGKTDAKTRFASTVAASDADNASQTGERELQWFKGNIHTHSLWSDGDDFPEMISGWYRDQGYNFLAISDHNTMQTGLRWMKQADVLKRGGKDVISKYEARFGKDWVETRGEAGSPEAEVRLKPFDEYRYLLEQSDKFILIPGEEVSDSFEGKPLHMNATNLGETLRPVGGSSMREAIENNIRQVLEQEKKLGREILMHLNHPNFHYAVTYEDLAHAVGEKFFEVFNGHPSVNQLGDEKNPGLERMWDLINHIRVNKLGYPPIFGLSTDDTHNYHGKGGSRPGRGWIMVRSRYLTPEHLIRAVEAGDFYSSSGVTLSDVKWNPQDNRLHIQIEGKPGVTYKTEFIVIDKDAEIESVSRVASTSTELTSSYQLNPGEVVVRALITSSEKPVDPVWDEQLQQAWSQPFVHSDVVKDLVK